MGKRLVILGADFSQNAIAAAVVADEGYEWNHNHVELTGWTQTKQASGAMGYDFGFGGGSAGQAFAETADIFTSDVLVDRIRVKSQSSTINVIVATMGYDSSGNPNSATLVKSESFTNNATDSDDHIAEIVFDEPWELSKDQVILLQGVYGKNVGISKANITYYVSTDGHIALYTYYMGFDVHYKSVGASEKIEYQECEYLENPSTAYINLGIIPKASDGFEIKFMSTKAVDIPAFGGRASGAAYVLWTSTSGGKGGIVWGGITTNIDIYHQIDTIYTEKLYSGTFYINGEQKATITSSTNGSSNLFLYTVNGTANGRYLVGRLYHFKWYSGGELVFDGVPMYRTSDGLYGLYDKISGSFYTSASSIQFTGKLL